MYSLTKSRIFTALAVMACVFNPMTSFADGDPIGTWNVLVDMAGTPVEAEMTVSEGDDGILTGSLTSAMGEAVLSGVTHDGDKLAFTQTFGEGDTALTFQFDGTIDGDTFSGMLSSEMGEMKVDGTRVAPADPVGDWDVEVDMAGTPVTAQMSVSKNDDGTLTGNLTSAMGEAQLSDVQFDGTNLSFTQTFGEGDTALTFEFAGAMSGDTFAGMLTSDMGEMAVKGARAAGSIVGEWTFTSDSQLGVITMPFIVNDDMSGTYSEYDLEDLAQDGKSVTFAVTIEVDGNELPLEFEGEMTGADSVEGVLLMEGAEVATVEIVRGDGV